jgi:stalled ribosome rescue protein Dom34
VTKVKRKKGYKRGYAVALLVGFEEDHAVLWQIFSQVAKLDIKLELGGKRANEQALYNFHESVVNALRPVLNEGVRSIVVTAPIKTAYADDFLDHVRRHHAYLFQSKSPNRANFAKLDGSADQPNSVANLVKTKEFREIIAETTLEEADYIVDELEKHLYSSDNNSVVLFSIKEIEDTVCDRKGGNALKTEYLMLTDKHLADCEDKNRINRLLQISKNRRVKTRIFSVETSAGKRINQFGGIIFFTVPRK